MSCGQSIIGGVTSKTVTVAVAEEEFPLASVPVKVTVMFPMKRLKNVISVF